jgi:hypothetical protein
MARSDADAELLNLRKLGRSCGSSRRSLRRLFSGIARTISKTLTIDSGHVLQPPIFLVEARFLCCFDWQRMRISAQSTRHCMVFESWELGMQRGY